jgi:hypothetical protein
MIATLEVNETAAKRIEAQKEAYAANGFRDTGEFFAAGTRLAESGKKTWNELRRKHEERPLVGEACEQLVDRVRAEERRDHTFALGAMQYLPSDTLSTDEGFFGLEPRGFRMLARYATPGNGASYLAACPPMLRTFNMNQWLASEEKKADKVTLRTRKDDAGRRVWAVVSDSYSPYDADEIAKLAAEICDPTARATVAYDGFRTRIDVMYHSTITAEEAGVGEVFRGGISIDSGDDGTRAVRVTALAERVRCVNLTRLSSQVVTGKVTHKDRGARTVADEVRAAVKDAHDRIATFAHAWAQADKDEILGGDGDPRKKFEALVHRGHVKVTGCRKDELVNRLVRAWEREPARYTRTALLNAITRAAHENPWTSPWTAHELEETAGRLLYVRNLSLN